MYESEKMLQSLPCLEESLSRALEGRSKNVLPPDGMTIAAVLIPLYSKDGRTHVLLTKRSEFVEHHRGEISFPGGKLDPEDPDLRSCALRETDEEVGIAPEDIRIIGELDDFYTVATDFLVVPFVGIIPYPYDFRPSAREIADLIGVPLEVFFDPERRSEEMWTIKGQSVEIISYRWKEHNIWGATARILKHFTEVLDNGKSHNASPPLRVGAQVDETTGRVSKGLSRVRPISRPSLPRIGHRIRGSQSRRGKT